MKEKIEQLKALNHKAELGGGEDRIAKQHASSGERGGRPECRQRREGCGQGRRVRAWSYSGRARGTGGRCDLAGHGAIT